MNKKAKCSAGICRLLCFMVVFPMWVNAVAKPQENIRITLKLENATLAQAIDDIRQQSSYLFANKDVDLDKRVSISVTEETIHKVCELLFTPLGVDYRIDGHHIYISSRPPQKPVQIHGTVIDGTGYPVLGAAVIESGTTNGTTTDLDGNFSLTVSSASASIEITSLGYDAVTLPVGTRTVFEVALREEAVALEGTVVTALGIRRDEKALSYNVQEVKSDAITAVRDANFINALSGKVAGVNINASSSGVGGASKVVLRGTKSISQSSNALYVIDGIPMYNFGGGGETEFGSKGASESIADLNPDDIESISVLTGAAAAALYGSSAANGAVMITTKSGREGQVKVTFSSNTEFLSPFVLPRLQNRYGTGSNGSADGSAVYSYGPKLNVSSGGYTPYEFFETGHVYTNSFTLSGGTDKNQTYFSAAAVNSDGFIPNNFYDRYNFTFRNTTYLLKDKLRIDASASYIMQSDQNMTNQGLYSNPLVPVYLFPRGESFSIYRIFERYNPDTKLMEQFWSGDLEGGDLRMQNPYWIAYRNLRNNSKKRYMLSLNVDYDILDWLNVSGRVRIDNANSLFTQKLYATTNTTLTDGGSNGHYSEKRTYDSQTYADIMVNVDKTWGDWSLGAHAGASLNDISTDALSYSGPIREEGLPNVFNVFDLDDLKKRASKEGWREQTRSLFASVEVGWKSMLYLTVTGRNDWASQLVGSPQSSFFYPSAGLSWVPTSVWDMGNALSYLKIRGSVASVGMPFPRYLTTSTYAYDATNKVYETKTHYPIGELKPERTTTYELGAEATLWESFRMNLSWYWADTFNQTFDPQLPPSSSYSTIYLQTGHVRNIGVEASAGYTGTWQRFTWDTNFTFSWNKNEIINLADDVLNPVTGEPLNIDKLDIKALGKTKFVLKKGGTLGDLYTSSDLRRDYKGYIEIDSGGGVSVVDDGEDFYLGSVFPKYNLAWRNDFSWKGIHLGILFSGRIGGICYSATQANLDLYGVSEVSAEARDRGSVIINGRDRIDPQKWYQTVGAQSGLPQYYTYSATNFRLAELSLGWTLPRKWFRNKLGLTLSFVGRNLWMIWCEAPFDPEAVASTGLNYQGIDYFMMPSTRNLGLNIKLDF